MPFAPLPYPPSREAVKHITALEQENARLRKALEWVASNEVDPLDRNRRAQLEAAIRRARAALTTPGQEHEVVSGSQGAMPRDYGPDPLEAQCTCGRGVNATCPSH